MRPGSHFSHHTNNDNLTNKELNWRNKQGCIVLCSLIEITECCKPHLYPHTLQLVNFSVNLQAKKSSDCRFIGRSISGQNFRLNSPHMFRFDEGFDFPDLCFMVTRNVHGYPKAPNTGENIVVHHLSSGPRTRGCRYQLQSCLLWKHQFPKLGQLLASLDPSNAAVHKCWCRS
jgi:hypothetical protein